MDGERGFGCDLVAMACEILVLVKLVEHELPVTCSEPQAREIRMGWRRYRSAAEQLLSDSASTQEHSLVKLCSAIDVGYTQLVNVRGCVTASQPCGHARLRTGGTFASRRAWTPKKRCALHERKWSRKLQVPCFRVRAEDWLESARLWVSYQRSPKWCQSFSCISANVVCMRGNLWCSAAQ
jgi:hypothetical protein